MDFQSEFHLAEAAATSGHPGDLLAVGFGTTVAMWAAAYVGHMPLVDLPPSVFVTLMLVCLVLGGWAVGRYTPRGISGGVAAGLISALLNLLILGSLLAEPGGGQVVPRAWLWVPGMLALSTLLSAAGALAGRTFLPLPDHEFRAAEDCLSPSPLAGATNLRSVPGGEGRVCEITARTSHRLETPHPNPLPQGERELIPKAATLDSPESHQPEKAFLLLPSDADWTAALAWVASAAALLLILAGGLTTGFRAGMAVPDWPNSFGWNMFLFPFSRMTGGVFYEHAHRLFGTLVGAASLALAIYATATIRGRRRLIAFLWLLGAAVLVQGIMGGLRVTADSYVLAVIHGFFAHAILGGMVLVAVLLSPRWPATGDWSIFRREDSVLPIDDGRKHGPGYPLGAFLVPAPGADRLLTGLVAGLVLVQTLLGVVLRQISLLLLTHVAIAVVAALAALGTGMRAWGRNPALPSLRRTGLALMLVVLVQMTLGIVAVAVRTPRIDQSPSADALAAGGQLPVAPLRALLTTAHQTNAAVLLGVGVVLALWTWRQVPSAAENRGGERAGREASEAVRERVDQS
ncbi:MAG: COX15/CtaA family protein [Thermoguttaceae bacterium]